MCSFFCTSIVLVNWNRGMPDNSISLLSPLNCALPVPPTSCIVSLVCHRAWNICELFFFLSNPTSTRWANSGPRLVNRTAGGAPRGPIVSPWSPHGDAGGPHSRQPVPRLLQQVLMSMTRPSLSSSWHTSRNKSLNLLAVHYLENQPRVRKHRQNSRNVNHVFNKCLGFRSFILLTFKN